MAGSCSIVIIAHRLSTVRGADNILVIQSGQVSEEGTHDTLMAKDGIYASLVKQQLAGDEHEGEADGGSKDDGRRKKEEKLKRRGQGKGKGKDQSDM